LNCNTIARPADYEPERVEARSEDTLSGNIPFQRAQLHVGPATRKLAWAGN